MLQVHGSIHHEGKNSTRGVEKAVSNSYGGDPIGSSDCIEHVFIPRVHGSNHYGGKNTTRGVVIKLVTSSGASASVWLVAGLLQSDQRYDQEDEGEV